MVNISVCFLAFDPNHNLVVSASTKLQLNCFKINEMCILMLLESRALFSLCFIEAHRCWAVEFGNTNGYKEGNGERRNVLRMYFFIWPQQDLITFCLKPDYQAL